jgi:hypothetical protein
MSTYVIQRPVEVADAVDLRTELASVRAVAAAMTATGQPLRLISTTYIPAEGTCLSVVDAEDAATVIEALRRAGTRAARVLPALIL